MSMYVEWLNQIKLKADSAWLTDAQKTAYGDVLERWPAQVFVCLCGPPGSGKSFIGRLLAKEHGFIYANELKEVEPGPHLVVIDGEDYSRLMRPAVRLLGLKRVVVLMRQPPQDPMPRAEIALTEHDVRQFQHNITKHAVLQSFKTNVDGTDLRQILRAEAIERGGTDVN
ncbi:MAG: hypothetical protein ISS52_03840 [Dehalococcoidia bacterium]|nr:hypothetical protein [Dehalococcoidia bacterium]